MKIMMKKKVNDNNVPPGEAYDLDKFNQEHPERTIQKEEYGKTNVNELTGFTEKEGIVIQISSPEKKKVVFSVNHMFHIW